MARGTRLGFHVIFAEFRNEPRYRDRLDRMRRDVDAQRTRARERGLLEIASLLEPAR